jgi:hypothetical protein
MSRGESVPCGFLRVQSVTGHSGTPSLVGS